MHELSVICVEHAIAHNFYPIYQRSGTFFQCFLISSSYCLGHNTRFMAGVKYDREPDGKNVMQFRFHVHAPPEMFICLGYCGCSPGRNGGVRAFISF